MMTEPVTTRDVPIMRDGNFTRATADNAIIIPLGRDVELAFLAVSPTPITNRVSVDDNGNESSMAAVQIQNSLYEVARVRLSSDAVNVIATQLIIRAVESGISLETLFDNAKEAIGVNIKSDGTFAND